MSGSDFRFTAALPALLLVGALVVLLLFAPESLREEGATAWRLLWRGDAEPLREWILAFGGWGVLISILLQLVTSLFPPLPGFPIFIANAMVWGPWLGGLLSWTTGVGAAAACFGIARRLGRPGVERLVDPKKLARVDGFMERRGVLAVFLARLIPFINPDLASYAAGVTSLGWGPFLLAMSAGSLPAVVFYTVIGVTAVEATGPVLGVVAATSVLPLALLWFLRHRIPGISG